MTRTLRLADPRPDRGLGLAGTAGAVEHRLYVAEPGIRNYLEYGGHGLLVFDIDHGHKFVKRIPTAGLDPKAGKPINVKGDLRQRRDGQALHQHDPAADVPRPRHREDPLGEDATTAAATGWRSRPTARRSTCRRSKGRSGTSSTPLTGDVIARIEPNSGAHNTIYGPDGKEVYLAGLKSPLLTVADTQDHTDRADGRPVRGERSGRSRSTAAQTLCFVNVNELLGFEVGDLKTGKKLHRVEVAGFEKGPVKRHGCPSHGIGLTPDEKELWVVDAYNRPSTSSTRP